MKKETKEQKGPGNSKLADARIAIQSVSEKVLSALKKLRNLDGSGGTHHERLSIDEDLNLALVSLTEAGADIDLEEELLTQTGEQQGVEEHTSALDPQNTQAEVAATINQDLPADVRQNEKNIAIEAKSEVKPENKTKVIEKSVPGKSKK